MKEIAPFLGVSAPDRRAALKPVFKHLPQPTSDQLGKTILALMDEAEREYAYAAYDFMDYFVECADKEFLTKYGAKIITTKSWWDTVDGFGNAMVSPLMYKYPSKKLVTSWIKSDNIWLVRSAIQHQRGWRDETDIKYVLSLCAMHADATEFFITKAIGWALRDICRYNKSAVRNFLKEFPQLSKVAVREAERGLNR
jgi:3-methyladenine DNA glycosylase AlkD